MPAERQWWVLHTKPRQEKAIARELSSGKLPFYLPLVAKTTIIRRRRVTSQIPLFPSYMFLFGSEQDRVKSLTTNRIVQALPVHEPEQLEHDLRQIRRLIGANVPMTTESKLSAGCRVRVRMGPLAGIEGRVISRRDATRLLVAVNFLQKGASVEVDDFMLEPIE